MKPTKEANILLEPMMNTKNALYQTWKVSESQESMKDLHKELTRQKLVDNHIVIKFEEEKAIHHVKPDDHKRKENSENYIQRLPCPYCKAHFMTWKSVKRHIIHTHDKTMDVTESKRESILKNAFKGPPGVWNVLDKISNLAVTAKSEEPKACSKPELMPKIGINIIPVKSVQVGLKKLNLDKAEICKLIETEEVCPIIRKNIGPDQVIDERSVTEHHQRIDIIPLQVDRKIMEHINRRHLQCKICYKRFRGTFQAKQHVASIHLKLHR